MVFDYFNYFFFWIVLGMKVHVIVYLPDQIPCLVKFLFMSYELKSYWPIRLQDSWNSYISRTNKWTEFFFLHGYSVSRGKKAFFIIFIVYVYYFGYNAVRTGRSYMPPANQIAGLILIFGKYIYIDISFCWVIQMYESKMLIISSVINILLWLFCIVALCTI